MNKGKYILIGEAWLEIFFNGENVVNSYPGGEAVHIAEAIARSGAETLLLTELGNDTIGRQIAAKLKSCGVDVSYADVMAAKTSVVLRRENEIERYDIPSINEGFDITWPRVEREDVVAFGGYMALDARIHDRLWAFLSHCKERKAKIVYIPDVVDPRLQRITKVMPAVFENLEISDMIITLPGDLEKLYGYEDAARAYKNNLSFYCPNVAALKQVSAERCEVVAFGNVPEAEPASCNQLISDILMSDKVVSC